MEQQMTPEQLQMVSMLQNILKEELQTIRDEITNTNSRINLALTKQSADLMAVATTLTERIDDLAQSSSSSNNTSSGVSSMATPSNTPMATGTNLLSALASTSSKYGAGGIRAQIQTPAAAPPTLALTAQEVRDEAMDLRLRANMDFEKKMDEAGEAKVTKEGIVKFLHAWDIYSKNTGIVKNIFQRFGLESLAILAELHEDDPPPTTDGTLFRLFLDKKYCDDKFLPIQIIETFSLVKMPRKELTMAFAQTYLEDFLRAKRSMADRITKDTDIQATLVQAFHAGIRPMALLKRIRELPTTTLKAAIERFQFITNNAAEISLVNINEAKFKKNQDRQMDNGKTSPYVPREGKKALAVTVAEQQPPPTKRPTCANCTEGGGFHSTNKCGTKPCQLCKFLGFDSNHAPSNCEQHRIQNNVWRNPVCGEEDIIAIWNN